MTPATVLCACVACSTLPLPNDAAIMYLGSTESFAVPVHSIESRKFLTVVRQRYDFSCGSAALATLLRFHYADLQSEESVFLGMWGEGDRPRIRAAGFSLLDMKRYLARRGIGADGYSVSIADIARAGVPGIVLLNVQGYRHFAVLKGIDAHTALLGDPSLGLRRVSLTELTQQWNGVYFVLTSGAKPAQGSFNGGELALAPTGAMPAESLPLSLQALALTRPTAGDL